MNIDEIRALARLVADSNLAEIEVEEKGLKIRIRGPHPVEIQTVANVLPPAMLPAQALPAAAGQPLASEAAAPLAPAAAAAPTPAPAPAAEEIPSHWKEVSSPMVGTFYRSASPEADPFIQLGDTVRADTTLCIVEAMKLMNEIKAEMSGVVRKVLVENAQPVEFGQPMFLIEPA